MYEQQICVELCAFNKFLFVHANNLGLLDPNRFEFSSEDRLEILEG